MEPDYPDEFDDNELVRKLRLVHRLLDVIDGQLAELIDDARDAEPAEPQDARARDVVMQ